MVKPEQRIGAVWGVVFVGLLVLLGRAAQLQLLEGAEHAATAESVRTERDVLPAVRGAILDRWGNELVVSHETYRVNLTPSEFVDSVNTVAEIRAALGVPSSRLNRALRRRYGYLAGPFTSVQVQSIRRLPGVYVDPVLNRFRPYGDLAAAVLGHTARDGVPASGMERMLDTLLEGTPGTSVVLRDHLGGTYESPARVGAFPVPGHNVYLTIDIDLQDLVERSLADAMEKLQARGGNVIVLEPHTGHVLAIASRSRTGGATVSSFTSAFEPGSTAKIFAAAALLESGLVSDADSVWGESGRYITPHRTINDEHDEGWMTLFDVVRRSSNIGIAKLSSRLEPENQYAVMRNFGLGSPTGIEFPSESPGILGKPHRWSATSSASLAMGYEVAVTMLQLAQAYAALANDGVMVQPTLVKQVVAASGDVVYQHEPRPIRRVLSAAHADTLRSMLRAVVYGGGTGRAAALATFEVAGKTGTAKRIEDHEYVDGSYTTTFVSLFPASDPQFVMVVKLDDPAGAYSAASAVPLTRSMLEQLLAGRTPSLDRVSLLNPVDPVETPSELDVGSAPFRAQLPRQDSAGFDSPTIVPDVSGRSMRVAARELHAIDLQVKIEGWGPACHTTPPAGSTLPYGSTVTLVCSAPGEGG